SPVPKSGCAQRIVASISPKEAESKRCKTTAELRRNKGPRFDANVEYKTGRLGPKTTALWCAPVRSAMARRAVVMKSARSKCPATTGAECEPLGASIAATAGDIRKARATPAETCSAICGVSCAFRYVQASDRPAQRPRTLATSTSSSPSCWLLTLTTLYGFMGG